MAMSPSPPVADELNRGQVRIGRLHDVARSGKAGHGAANGYQDRANNSLSIESKYPVRSKKIAQICAPPFRTLIQ